MEQDIFILREVKVTLGLRRGILSICWWLQLRKRSTEIKEEQEYQAVEASVHEGLKAGHLISDEISGHCPVFLNATLI